MHSFFYTRFPNFYEMMHNVAMNMQECDKHEDAAIRFVPSLKGSLSPPGNDL